VHPFHLQHEQSQGHNKLLDQLAVFDRKENNGQANTNDQSMKKPVSLKVIENPDKMSSFVIEDKNEILRLGSKAK